MTKRNNIIFKGLAEVSVSDYITQRGTGKPIQREGAIVYDFMPVILGEQFRTDKVLSCMLLRPQPVDAPFMLRTEAYEELGMKYVSKGKTTPALECYRIALDSTTSFTKFIGDIQSCALINENELKHMDISSELEEKLLKEIVKLNTKVNLTSYESWVEEIRSKYQKWKSFSLNDQKSREYVETSLKIGKYEEAFYSAKELGDKKLIQKVKSATPKEILDVNFLDKHIHDNFPESTIGTPRF